MTTRCFDVWLERVRVGQLVERDDFRVELRFLKDYLDDPDRPVLGQYFVDHVVPSYVETFPNGLLPRFFGHLLPEGLLRSLLVETHGLRDADSLGLLSVVGGDLPGAVRVTASDAEVPSGEEAPFEPPIRDTPAGELESSLRFSLAGVQLKFSVVKDQATLNLPAHDQYGDWIVKLANPVFHGLPENEWSMMTWARLVGFDVPECSLHKPSTIVGIPERFRSAGDVAFAIKRYDRDGTRRIHQEDFAQVRNLPIGESDKYKHLTYEKLGVAVRALVDPDGFGDFVRRLAFMVAIGNADAHLKNWSLLYPDGRSPKLAPMYDQVSTVAWGKLNQELGLKFAGNRRFEEVDDGTFQRFALRSGSDPKWLLTLVREFLDRLRGVWHDQNEHWPLLDPHRAELREHWKRVPLLRSIGELS